LIGPGPRFDDIDVDALSQAADAATRMLSQHPDVDDPRNYEIFLARARARWALGAAAPLVADDLRLAGRAVRREAGPRLHKLPPQRLKSRRLDPLHLALLCADPESTEQAGHDFGLNLVMVYAGAAGNEVAAEARVLSGFFASRRISGAADVVGLAAATYAATLGAIMRGDEREAVATLAAMNDGLADFKGEPLASGKRYLLQCAFLADLLGRREADASEHLARLVPYSLADREAARKVDPAGVAKRGLGAPDPAIPALVGLAALLNVELDLGALRDADSSIWSLAREIEKQWMLVE
jgi:hypothetical protein